MSHQEAKTISPHRQPGIFTATLTDRSKWNFEEVLVTKNLTPNTSIGEYDPIVVLKGNVETDEYRVWSGFICPLAASILGGVEECGVLPGQKVLITGFPSPISVAAISDIVGNDGHVYVYILDGDEEERDEEEREREKEKEKEREKEKEMSPEEELVSEEMNVERPVRNKQKDIRDLQDLNELRGNITLFHTSLPLSSSPSPSLDLFPANLQVDSFLILNMKPSLYDATQYLSNRHLADSGRWMVAINAISDYNGTPDTAFKIYAEFVNVSRSLFGWKPREQITLEPFHFNSAVIGGMKPPSS